MSEKNSDNPLITQKDHLAPGDDPRDVLRQHEAVPAAPAPEKQPRETEKDNEDEDDGELTE